MRKLIILLSYCLIVSLLSSCGTIQKTVDKVFKKQKRSDDSTSTVKKDSCSWVQTVTSSDIDTTVHTKKDTVSGHESAKSFLQGNDITVDDGNTRLQVHYDPATGQAEAQAISKGQSFTVHEHKAVSQTQAANVAATAQVHIQHTDISQSSTVSKQTISKPGIAWYWYLIAALLILGIVFFVAYKTAKKMSI